MAQPHRWMLVLFWLLAHELVVLAFAYGSDDKDRLLSSETLAAGRTVRVPGLATPLLASCVHEVPVGAHVRFDDPTHVVIELNGVEIARKEKCARLSESRGLRQQSRGGARSPPHPFEWKAWTEFNAGATPGDSLVSLSGNWTVPQAPAKPSMYSLYYLGQGAMPQSNSVILQAMLQWGYGAPSGGSQSWALAAWLVGDGTGFFTPLLDVAAGLTVGGATTLQANGTWRVAAYGRGQEVHFTTNAKVQEELTWAYNVAEIHNLNVCSEYPPNTLEFTNLALRTAKGAGAVAWTPQRESEYPLLCNETATSTGSAETTVHWNLLPLKNVFQI